MKDSSISDKNSNMFKIAAVILMFAMIFPAGTGCESMTHTQQQGTAIGTIGGVLLGAGLGALAGGRNGAIMGAVAGAAVGLIAGQEWAKRIEAKRAQYRTEQERLQATITETRNIEAEVHEKNAQLQADIASTSQKVNALIDAAAGQAVDRRALATAVSDARKQQQKLSDLKTELNQTIISENNALQAAKALKLDTTALLTEVDKLRAELKTAQASELEIQSLLAKANS